MRVVKLWDERSNFPLIPELVALAHSFKDKVGIVNARYGKRMVSSAVPLNMKEISKDLFVEIVDYDIPNNTMLYIGKIEPHEIVALDWIVMRAREDVNFMVHLVKEISISIDPFEEAKEVLGSIKSEGLFYEDERSTIILGKSLDDVRKFAER